jgi:lipoprotein signal peptidase
MESWSYKQNDVIEGPVDKDQLKALYDAGEITAKTLVWSAAVGGGWRPYGALVDLRPAGALSRIPLAVKKLWPWFVFGTPLIGGVIDVVLMRSTGNAFVESNAWWLSHTPIAVSLLAIILWLSLIAIEVFKGDKKDKLMALVIWVVAATVYQAFSWWAIALVSGLINVAFGFGLLPCQADIATGEVRRLFEKTHPQAGRGVAFADIQQKWTTDRIRMCTAKLAATGAQTYSVRYKIEDRGNSLFRNTMHGLNVTILVE